MCIFILEPVLSRSLAWDTTNLYTFRFVIYCSNGKDGLAEWGIIELQGDLAVRGEELMDGHFIGDLNYDKYGQPVNTLKFELNYFWTISLTFLEIHLENRF